jgi:glucose/mannose-6-phosphate isomerase
MKTLIQAFPNQLAEAIALYKPIALKARLHAIRQVVVVGMGGSAIGGLLVKQGVIDQLAVPLEINQDYTLPAYVNRHTLLIIISYSGNTEETIQALEMGYQKKASMVCMSATGLLSKLAKQYDLDWLALPLGMPPRTCLAYIIVAILAVLRFYKLVSSNWELEFDKAIALLAQKEFDIKQQAKQIAETIQGKMPIIYTLAAYEGVAIRWRQQFNENSKQLCWHHTIPALNHNEIVGWQDPDDRLVVLMLVGSLGHDRSKLQQVIAQRIIQQACTCCIAIQGLAISYWCDAIYWIHLGDWTSWYLAQQKGINPLEVANIDCVKGYLAQQ